jgi:hypothetical protein
MGRGIRLAVVATMVAAAAGVAMAAPANAAPANAARLTATSALLRSSTPKYVVFDAKTGAVVSVQVGSSGVTPLIGIDNPCTATDACYYPVIPYAAFGFHGVGSAFGSWVHRTGGNTGNWTADFCWQGGFCTLIMGPHTRWSFANGGNATGTEVDIYS